MAVFLTKRGTKIFPLPSSTTVGDVITWDDKEWIVVHYDTANRLNYLMSKDIVSDIEVHDYHEFYTYDSSNLFDAVLDYQQNQMSSDALELCKSVAIERTSAKVFIATQAQVTGGFSYFPSNTAATDRRVALYKGNPLQWWTSSKYNDRYAWYVRQSGVVDPFDLDEHGGSYNYFAGFRPCVCVQM